MYTKKFFSFILCIAFSFCILPTATFANDTIQVLSTGIGRTEDEAKVQAYRNAIRSAIGSFVVTNTLIENDQIIQDKILTHSDGYVTEATQVGDVRSLDNGLLEVTMNITVKSQLLQEKLEAESISTTSIDGQGILGQAFAQFQNEEAQKITQAEQKQNAQEILAEKLKNIPAGLIKAEADMTKAKLEYTKGGLVRTTIPVRLFVDKNKYKSLVQDLKTTFTKLNYQSSPITTRLYGMFGTQDNLRNFKGKRASREIPVFSIAEIISLEGNFIRWVSYALPPELNSVFKEVPLNILIQADLQDAHSNTLVSQERIIYGDGSKRPGRQVVFGKDHPNFAFIFPALMLEGGNKQFINIPPGCSTPDLFFDIVFDLTEEELKAVNNITFSITNL